MGFFHVPGPSIFSQSSPMAGGVAQKLSPLVCRHPQSPGLTSPALGKMRDPGDPPGTGDANGCEMVSKMVSFSIFQGNQETPDMNTRRGCPLDGLLQLCGQPTRVVPAVLGWEGRSFPGKPRKTQKETPGYDVAV